MSFPFDAIQGPIHIEVEISGPTGRSNLRQVAKMVFVDPELRANRYGPAHLWFLEYLTLMLAGFVLLRLASRRAPGAAPGWAAGNRRCS